MTTMHYIIAAAQRPRASDWRAVPASDADWLKVRGIVSAAVSMDLAHAQIRTLHFPAQNTCSSRGDSWDTAAKLPELERRSGI